MANFTMVDQEAIPGHPRTQIEEIPQHEYPVFPTSDSQGKSEVSFFPKEMTSHPQEQPYSVFTKSEKNIAVFLVTFAATFSPLSSFIFFPAINALSVSLRVSVEKINLTVTSYMIVAGLAPAIMGDMADMTGRRNVTCSVCLFTL